MKTKNGTIVYVVCRMTSCGYDFLGIAGVFWTEAEAEKWVAARKAVREMADYRIDEAEIGGEE